MRHPCSVRQLSKGYPAELLGANLFILREGLVVLYLIPVEGELTVEKREEIHLVHTTGDHSRKLNTNNLDKAI